MIRTAATALLVVLFSATASADPTDDLRRRDIFGEVWRDTTSAARVQPTIRSNTDVGLSFVDGVPVGELAYFPTQRRLGVYFGLGFKDRGFEAGTERLIHGGIAFQMTPEIGCGAGISQASETLLRTVRHYSPQGSWTTVSVDDADDTTVHGWMQVGLARGIAFRMQFGAAGPGVGIHWRSLLE